MALLLVACVLAGVVYDAHFEFAHIIYHLGYYKQTFDRIVFSDCAACTIPPPPTVRDHPAANWTALLQAQLHRPPG